LVVMRVMPGKVIRGLMVLAEQVGLTPYLMAIVAHGILSPMADRADKAGQGALPMMEGKAERAVRVATAQAAIARRAERVMGEGVVRVA
jgi:hypothetical protein